MKYPSKDELIAEVETLHSGGYSISEIIEYLGVDNGVMPIRKGGGNPTKNLSGMRFGKLTVLVGYQEEKRKDRLTKWVCLCDCGNATITPSRNLKRGDTKSCGCSFIKDLTGRRFGRLVVVELCRERAKRSQARWICQCDCGEIAIVRAGGLRQGTKSCGCLRRDVAAAKCAKMVGALNHHWNPNKTDEDRKKRAQVSRIYRVAAHGFRER